MSNELVQAGRSSFVKRVWKGLNFPPWTGISALSVGGRPHLSWVLLPAEAWSHVLSRLA